MEVADQWRREWAGTAEYGKVTEGGVTRRIARAMEVLHASGPGARVRVMRAAYHSSAAPGTPAASYMLHSSRRVISSGFNFLESPSTPIRPLEISSTPLESLPEPNTETENYKVTEPDDFEISEPSKWRGSAKGSSIRMPSEESSSTDNASIIDLDSRLGRNLQRKYSYDSENSDIQFGSRNNSRNSPLLDTPVTLSTLKYKSLLNSSNEWNTRRKSYSFEDTSPLNETVIDNNDILAMESSTDSGICKSTEIVNDHMDDSAYNRYVSKDERKTNNKEDSFQNWLSKNRPASQYRGTKFKTYREHDVVMEDALENNIAVQSSGKVSITLPVTIETDDEPYPKKNQMNEEFDRKVKRVEFCKTELHFAAESGKVKIIATDEKPPPSTDFKKRRSAFVPLQDMIEKPITLFGEKNDFSTTNVISTTLNIGGNEFGESDENTAATKSILKNKIPKPKPYLLGENMAFGLSGELNELKKDPANDSVLSAVSLVNKQLNSETRYNGEVKSIFRRETDESVIEPNVLRTFKTGPIKNDSLKHEKPAITQIKVNETIKDTIEEVKNKFNGLQVSPAQRKPKTRQLRDSELTYFGVDNGKKYIHKDQNTFKTKQVCNDNSTEKYENLFHSVKLIQQVSNSVCNSEPESDDTQQYQNIPLNINYAPVPTPRLRSKYDEKPNEINEIKVFKPIIENENIEKGVVSCTRRTKHRRQDETFTNRSISAPPKAFRRGSPEKTNHREDRSTRSSHSKSGILFNDVKKMDSIKTKNTIEDNVPIYVNLNINTEKTNTLEEGDSQKLKTNSINSRQRKFNKINNSKHNVEQTADIPSSDLVNISDRNKQTPPEKRKESSPRQKPSINKDTLSRTAYKDTLTKRADKTDKTRYVSETREKTSDELNKSRNPHKSRAGRATNEKNSTNEKKDDLTRSVPRTASKAVSEDTSRNKIVKRNELQVKDDLVSNNRDASSNRKKNSSKDKTVKETVIPSQNSSYTARNLSIQSNSANKDFDTKLNSHASNKRREYVINYDDKNGTVSSICKITPNLGIPKRKKNSKEIFKDNHKDKILKNRTIDKIAPLQLGDRQEEHKGLNNADRKWKTKVHVQRSCQVL